MRLAVTMIWVNAATASFTVAFSTNLLHHAKIHLKKGGKI
jgi:hypothetical protein